MSKLTYISLFSSAGVGCYGFKQAGFECVATNELISRRLDIQRFNNKCKYDSGYICGDITKDETKEILYSQIELWKKKEKISKVDVVIATPPCQGMSVANHKKTNTEIIRNSLVIESIKIIKEINPRFFVFENVPAFMKTICTDIDGVDKTIAEAIENNLGQKYSYTHRIINFKNYGACSSRQRTLVIGVSKEYADEISPFELYPDLVPEKTLRNVIGHLKPLEEFGEIDREDIYHAFRVYPEHMRSWIAEIKEGESAFDNKELSKKPHQVIDGTIVVNKQKNGDKYKRQYWDKVGPCIHTRNDQLASQNTVHPKDDRVFSIRELMLMMTVPATFKWCDADLDFLNALSLREKTAFLKKEEIKIRQSLGEAVPTAIFNAVANKIANSLKYSSVSTSIVNKIVESNNLTNAENLVEFVTNNPLNLSTTSLCKVAELANTHRTDNAAYFTNKYLITEMMKALPETEKETVYILEPSVGVGNFIPLILKKFEGKNIHLDVVDIDEDSLRLAKVILSKYKIPNNVEINFIADDFLTHSFERKYDYVVGNPPFFKMKSSDKLLSAYRKNAINKATTNICEFFLEKALKISNYVALVFPKFLLNTPEFSTTREFLSIKAVDAIIDFGEKGFPGVLVETLAILINNLKKPLKTKIKSVTHGISLTQQQRYIFDKQFPYWVIYRNEMFDDVCKKLEFGVFTVFRDRQITNQLLAEEGDIRVYKSRNISDDGKQMLDIDGYDSFISSEKAKELAVYEFYDKTDVYLTPNMTYYPRLIRKPVNCLVNGSVAILMSKLGVEPTEKQMEYISSKEYRDFYQIARNYQTRSLNVDACSVFFYGLLKEI